MSVIETAPPSISLDGFSTRLLEAEAARQKVNAITRLRQIAELTGLTVCCFDYTSGEIVSQGDEPAWLPAELKAELIAGAASSEHVDTYSDVVTVSLGSRDYVGVAIVPESVRPVPVDVLAEAHIYGWTEDDLANWWSRNSGRSADDVRRLLKLASRVIEAESLGDERDREIAELAEQVDSTFDEISLLHFLAQNLQVSRDTVDLATLCLTRLRESLGCEGAAIWIAGESGASQYHCDGRVPFDELELALMLAQFEDHHWPEPLVLNHSSRLPCGPEQGISSLVVAPLQRNEQRVGWLVALNASSVQGFSSVESGLLRSIAVSLGTHLQNAAVVAEQEELLLSFVRSLVSSLDAKDRYTRGHSERVAMIARRIGIELGLPDEEIEDIYLAGLLHDVGKIGVDDAILRKPGRLTDEEFDEIKKHPCDRLSDSRGHSQADARFTWRP